MHLKMSSTTYQPFCSGLNVELYVDPAQHITSLFYIIHPDPFTPTQGSLHPWITSSLFCMSHPDPFTLTQSSLHSPDPISLGMLPPVADELPVALCG